MKVDFKKVQLFDIDGKKVKGERPLYKDIAAAIFFHIKNLDLVEVARQINTGKVVELSKTDLTMIRTLLLSEKTAFYSFTKDAITKYLDSLKEGT